MSKSEEETETIQQYFKVIQDPIRRNILKMVSDYEALSFSEIRDKLSISAEKASKLVYHLQQLETMGLIEKNEENRYESTGFGDKLLSDLQIMESTIRTGTIIEKWIEDISEKYPNPPVYIVEIKGRISVVKEKFDSAILVTRLAEYVKNLGLNIDTSRYTEKDELGKIKTGWLVSYPLYTIDEESEYPESGIRIFDDGSFYVGVYFEDLLRLFPYYDFEKHKKLLDEGEAELPFFFTQIIAYSHFCLLQTCAHILWGKNFEIALEPPKIKYMWITGKENEVNIQPIWIDELKEISWNKLLLLKPSRQDKKVGSAEAGAVSTRGPT